MFASCTLHYLGCMYVYILPYIGVRSQLDKGCPIWCFRKKKFSKNWGNAPTLAFQSSGIDLNQTWRPTWSGRRCNLGWPYPHIYFRIPLLHIYSHLRCQQLRCERTTSSTPFKFFDFRGACALRRTPLQRKRVDKIPSWSAARALRGSRGSYKQIPSIW